MSETPIDNMALWKVVSETDPANTKSVSQRGGFTAICAQSQIMAATQQWGPYGSTWGVKDCLWSYVRDSKNEILEIALEAIFWYPGGEFPLSTDKAYRAGDDNRKKACTDLTTKALSKLGFNADVFLGLYDDNKYIAEMKAKYSEEPTAQGPSVEEAWNKLVSQFGDRKSRDAYDGLFPGGPYNVESLRTVYKALNEDTTGE